MAQYTRICADSVTFRWWFPAGEDLALRHPNQKYDKKSTFFFERIKDSFLALCYETAVEEFFVPQPKLLMRKLEMADSAQKTSKFLHRKF